MSHNENTPPFQSSEGPSHSRRRLYPDSARNPSMRGIQFSPLLVNPSSSRSPLVPPVPLSQGEQHQPILPTGAASQHSINHLEPWRASSSNPSSKRNFASAFEDLEFRQSMQRAAVDPQTGWFPDIQSPEDFDYQSRAFAVRSKGPYDAMIDNIWATKAEEQNHVPRNQDTILPSYRRNAGGENHVFCCPIGTVQASIEKERRLREQAEQAREAAEEKAKELEGKLAAVMKDLDQERALIGHMLKVNKGLQADMDSAFYGFMEVLKIKNGMT